MPLPTRTPARPRRPTRKAAALARVPNTFPAAVAALPAPTSTRDRILLAATAVLNEEGYGALTQVRVAERAGVRQSHITYYFPARVDLLLETAAFSCNAMMDAMSHAVDGGELTLENFRSILISDVSDRRFARLMCGLIASSDEDPRIKRWLADFEESNRQRLLSIFHRIGLPVTLTQVEQFHATFVGAVILDMGEATPESLARSERIVQDAFARLAAEGLASKSPPSANAPKATRRASARPGSRKSHRKTP
ncbi:MAG: TetR/AcrR family transcriptional regulator [Betaproteobacteria bacterium]|nr:TetR/AcrR family transcriptional regulator [Betaproteobacteria bacterium]